MSLLCACDPSLMIGTVFYSLYPILLALISLLTRLTTGGKQEKAKVGRFLVHPAAPPLNSLDTF